MRGVMIMKQMYRISAITPDNRRVGIFLHQELTAHQITRSLRHKQSGFRDVTMVKRPITLLYGHGGPSNPRKGAR
jgi:hypothetical protein